MNKLKNLYCIVGKSGSGKSAIVNLLKNKYGYEDVKSYTTRPRRSEMDNDHTYITEEEYDKLDDIVASCTFNGYRYAVTKTQVDDADLYIVDFDGLKELKEKYNNKRIVTIYIDTDMDNRYVNMKVRGDSDDEIWQRLRHDEEHFEANDILHVDHIFRNDVLLKDLVLDIAWVISSEEE